jgi:hypothetical protein
MLTTKGRKTLIVIAPLLTVYLMAIAALSQSPPITEPKQQPQALCVPDSSTFRIENASFHVGEKKTEESDSLPWTGIAIAIMAGFFAILTTRLQENRLRVEAFNKSAELLTKRGNGVAGSHEGAAVVYSLVSLGEYDYALETIRTLWPTNEITRTAAVWAINKIFERRGVPLIYAPVTHWFRYVTRTEANSLKEYASNTLWLNAPKLRQDDGGVEWPAAFAWSWTQVRVPPYVHSCLVRAMLALLVQNPRRTWAKSNMDAMLGRLNQARTSRVNGETIYKAARIELILLQNYHFERRAVQIGDRKRGSHVVSVESLITECQDSLTKDVPRLLKNAGSISGIGAYRSNEYAERLEDDFIEGLRILESRGWNQLS